ncbi:zinc-ribbon domain-containing protein [Sorangium sp. So ce1099]|uniref:zinc-ribbon domain-containing protein n=1 Tax=Sorangium sp. So ce1099 TaxID=3133331 RepID=UPI003F62C287
MKITCESCQAKYTIADEKVVGKTVKIKCKKCNHAMVVHGANEAAPAPGSLQDATVGQQGDLSDDADAGGAPAAGASPDTWTVNVAEGDERTMTTAELVAAYGRGDLSNDTYVWKDGMGDWLPIASVPELRQQFAPQADAAPAAAAVAAAAPAPAPAAAAVAAAAAAPAPAVVAPAAAAVAAVPTPAAVPAAAAAAVPVAPAPAGLKFGPEGTVVMKDGGRRGLNQPGAAPSAAAAAVPAPAAAAASPAAAAPAAAAPAAAPAAAAPAAAAPAAAPAAAAPAAARRAGRPAAVDVFSAAERAAEPAAAPAPQPGADRQVGERNENSVLFSLSALTATENAAAKQAPEESPSGRRPSSRPAKNNGRAGYDDLLNLGGGAIASAPMLAPPPLLAPVGDSRPPPSMSSSAKASVPPAALSSLSSLSPLAAPEAPAKKSRMGLIAAALAVVVLIGGVAIFFMQAPKEETATPEQTNTAPAEATPPVETTAPAPTPPPAETAAAATPPSAETAAPSAEPAADAPAPGAATPTPGQASPGAAERPADRDRPAAPAGAGDKPAAQKPAEAAPAGGAEFNRGAASSALGAAASSAKSCKKAGGPTGTGKVKVTFAPSGNVTSAEVQGAPFAGTSVGGCVARLFRGARVPAFGGGPVSVSKSFTIN